MRRLLKWLSPGAAPGPDPELCQDGNAGAPRVLVFTEHLNATYFISFDLPLRALHAAGKANFAVASQRHVAAGGWDRWHRAFRPDVVVMSRYGQADGGQIMEFFQGKGIPVIYHIDDDLLALPESLGAEIGKRHGAKPVIATRTRLLAGCDLIYASTATLAAVLRQRFPDRKIYCGMSTPYVEQPPHPRLAAPGSPRLIGYMGSKGHQPDLELAVPALERLLDERPDLEFEVFGTIRMPSRLERFGRRVRSRPVQQDYAHFLATLAGLGWEVGLAPLADIPFNRCKTPTKYVEYTACGIPTVASNLPVYAEAMPPDGGLLVEHDWYPALARCLDDAALRGRTVEAARRHCRSAYSLERLQRQLLDVLGTARRDRGPC